MDRALAIAPLHKVALLVRGALHCRMQPRQLEQAVQCFNKVRMIDQTDVDAYNVSGAALPPPSSPPCNRAVFPL